MDDKLKILMVSDSFLPILGGREHVIDHLMTQFSDSATPTLLTSTLGETTPLAIDSTLPYNVIRCKSLRLTKNEFLSIVDKKTKLQINKMCEERIDIIHTQTKYSLCSYALKLGKKYNIPVITTCHTLYPVIYKIQLKFKPIHKLFINHVKKIINKTDGVITVSEFMKNTLIEMGVTTPITVIPNGNDMIKYKDLQFNQEEFKSKYNLSQVDNIFCFVGRLNPVKNIDIMFNTLKQLKDYKINFKTLIIGSGKTKKYKKLAKKLGIEDQLIFTGAIKDREELAKIYSISDLHLLFSTTETFGLNVREAGIMGTPTVAIKNTASSESIIDNVTGFVSELDINKLTKTMICAISDKEKLKTIGRKAEEFSSISWKNVSDLHIKYYENYINKHKDL